MLELKRVLNIAFASESIGHGQIGLFTKIKCKFNAIQSEMNSIAMRLWSNKSTEAVIEMHEKVKSDTGSRHTAGLGDNWDASEVAPDFKSSARWTHKVSKGERHDHHQMSPISENTGVVGSRRDVLADDRLMGKSDCHRPDNDRCQVAITKNKPWPRGG